MKVLEPKFQTGIHIQTSPFQTAPFYGMRSLEPGAQSVHPPTRVPRRLLFLQVLGRTMRGSLALSSAGGGFSNTDLVKLPGLRAPKRVIG